MSRTDRLFEVIQILRSETRSITAEDLATRLEVSVRTIYRDIQTLQAMRTPIEGEAGVGYLMRQGYDLPPLNFTVDEIEAIIVGLSLISRTGDHGLKKAAQRVSNKIDNLRHRVSSLQVSDWGIPTPTTVDPEVLRLTIRNEQKLFIHYSDENANVSERIIQPIAIVYYVEAMVLVAWCELRNDFRHFRVDRIAACTLLEDYFRHQGDKLRLQWQSKNQP